MTRGAYASPTGSDKRLICGGLLNFPEELFYLHARVAERALQRVTINFIVERKNNYPPVLVLHLYVAAFSVNFDEAQTR